MFLIGLFTGLWAASLDYVVEWLNGLKEVSLLAAACCHMHHNTSAAGCLWLRLLLDPKRGVPRVLLVTASAQPRPSVRGVSAG